MEQSVTHVTKHFRYWTGHKVCHSASQCASPLAVPQDVCFSVLVLNTEWSGVRNVA
jgi:hypothetical protein